MKFFWIWKVLGLRMCVIVVIRDFRGWVNLYMCEIYVDKRVCDVVYGVIDVIVNVNCLKKNFFYFVLEF